MKTLRSIENKINPETPFEDCKLEREKYADNLTIFITDINGQEYYRRFFNNITYLDFPIEVSGFRNGIYLVFAVTGDTYVYKKMSKHSF